jgi:hypothetical protein
MSLDLNLKYRLNEIESIFFNHAVDISVNVTSTVATMEVLLTTHLLCGIHAQCAEVITKI